VTADGRLQSHHANIRVEREGYVATVTLDRPASKNACTGDMWVALGAAFRELSYSGVRAVLLTGAGGDFCTGADLGGGSQSDDPPRANPTMSTEEARDASSPPGDPSRANPTMKMSDAMRVLGDVVLAIHGCPVPVVAKVDGLCVGAGLGLALAADLTWCSDRARFSAIFAKRGLSLDFGTSWLLRQRIGVHKAKELAFTAKMISGAEAFELGLVNAVVPAAELDTATREVVDTIAAGPPIALASTKRELDHASTTSLAQALELETLAQSVNAQTDDLREALLAWIERRPPTFTGR
jgi:2-(1,2-epoxy-1,2-dihydrophenyl)acetyl-CoA isomerase